MDINLSALDIDELKDLQKKVGKLIEGWEDRKRQEAIAAAEEAARRHGFSLTDLGVGAKRGAKAPRVVRYINPEDPTQTWSGRGRRPAWIKDALAAGKSLDDLKP